MKTIFIIVFCFFCCITVDARTIHVGKNQSFKTVTSAVAAALAGDTILVDAGLYRDQRNAADK